MKNLLIYFLVGLVLKFSLDILYFDSSLIAQEKKLKAIKEDLVNRKAILEGKKSYWEKYQYEYVLEEYRKELENKILALEQRLKQEVFFNTNFIQNEGVTTMLKIRRTVQSAATESRISLSKFRFDSNVVDARKTGRIFIQIGFNTHIRNIWQFLKIILSEKENFFLRISDLHLNNKDREGFIFSIVIRGYL